MKSLSALTVPVAIALALLSAASTAQDRPNTTLVQKSKASVSTSSKATKAAQAPTAMSGANTFGAGAKQGAAGGQAAPTAERAYEGCHGKDSDA